MKNAFQQRSSFNEGGELFNRLMGNNATLPVVGQGATELMYSDRYAYEVVEVSEDMKTVRLEELDAKAKPGSTMGDQNWILTPTGRFKTIVWRHGSWKVKSRRVRFVKDILLKAGESSVSSILSQEERDRVYNGECYPQNVITGLTEECFEYSKISIIFGKRDYHYDWSF